MTRDSTRDSSQVTRQQLCDLVSACRNGKVAVVRCKGRNTKTWRECVKNDIEGLGL